MLRKIAVLILAWATVLAQSEASSRICLRDAL